MQSDRRPQFAWLLVVAVCLAGCGRPTLVTTPYVVQAEGPSHFDSTPPEDRTASIRVLYVTDRAAEDDDDGRRYGYGRSRGLEWGTAQVDLDPAPTWEQLVEDSTTGDRSRSYELDVGLITPMGAIGAIGKRQAFSDGRAEYTAAALDEVRAEFAPLQTEIDRRLAATSSKDVYVFVHGFNNSFDDAVLRWAQVWHFMGRVGVPIVYSWPAGFGGPFGYAYDRESGEFTVLHLKMLLTVLAEDPAIERIHVIAHSRGTDVATTAIRELAIRTRTATGIAGSGLKLETLVLAAPDLDLEVFTVRFIEENAFAAVKRLVIYSRKDDGALGIAQWLFSSDRRLGDTRTTDIKPEAARRLQEYGAIEFIDCDVSGFSSSHAYAFEHPAALSDLILVLRAQCAAGEATARPLEQPAPGLWRLTNTYRSQVQAPSEPTGPRLDP
ncbi:MAG: alpha/beta hydrolase [Phycisphaeraceae bacterium]|nr:alpha/beta hydrolase [Phycisphaeraceae bacterium]